MVIFIPCIFAPACGEEEKAYTYFLYMNRVMLKQFQDSLNFVIKTLRSITKIIFKNKWIWTIWTFVESAAIPMMKRWRCVFWLHHKISTDPLLSQHTSILYYIIYYILYYIILYFLQANYTTIESINHLNYQWSTAYTSYALCDFVGGKCNIKHIFNTLITSKMSTLLPPPSFLFKLFSLWRM